MNDIQNEHAMTVNDNETHAAPTRALKQPKLPNECKCIVLQGFGSVKQLKSISIPLPTPGDNEVLVNVKACGMNFLDLLVRQGSFEGLPKLPFIPGFECSGRIVKLGPNVQDFQVGDRVICLPKFFAWSEYLVVNSNFVYKIPESMSFKDAAAFSYSYLTAYILLFELGCVKSDQTVLFHSAGGSVGTALMQLAKLVKNVTMIGTCSKSKFEAIKGNAQYLFEENTDYTIEIKKLFPEGVDLVLDCLCGEHTNKGLSITKPLGKYILYGTSKNLDGESKNYFALAKNWWHVDKISPLKLYEENKSMCGFSLNNLIFNNVPQNRFYLLGIFKKLFALYLEQKIKPVIHAVYSFEDVSNAFSQLHTRQNIGKVILDPYFEENKMRSDIEKDHNSSDTSGPDDDPEDAVEPVAPEELL